MQINDAIVAAAFEDEAKELDVLVSMAEATLKGEIRHHKYLSGYRDALSDIANRLRVAAADLRDGGESSAPTNLV